MTLLLALVYVALSVLSGSSTLTTALQSLLSLLTTSSS
jgi:hypothetical protein